MYKTQNRRAIFLILKSTCILQRSRDERNNKSTLKAMVVHQNAGAD